MKVKPGYFLPVLPFLLALAMACSTQAPGVAPGPEAANSPSAAVAADGASVEPAPVSADRVVEFAAQQQAINDDWDEFHADFDQWRTGMSACDRAAAEEALRVFASEFGNITRQARDLPGRSIARELPDEAIQAATAEETALRALRDHWQPGNPDLLEAVYVQRNDGAGLLRVTAIAVDKLEEMDKPEDKAAGQKLADALAPVDTAWDQFYASYEALESDQIDLTAAEIVTRIRLLVDEQQAVQNALEGIPSAGLTDPAQDVLNRLIDAADTEADGLDDLFEAMRKAAKAESSAAQNQAEEQDDSDGSDSSAPPEGDENGADGDSESSDSSDETAPDNPGSGMPGDFPPLTESGLLSPGSTAALLNLAASGQSPTGATPGGESGIPQSTPMPPDYSEHFNQFENILADTRLIRKQSGRDLEGIIEGVSEEDLADLAEFTRAYGDLMQDWDDFHTDFDRWVRTEGDCDRAGAVAELNQFSQSFNALESRVLELSQISYLSPSSDLLAEASEREGAALRSLVSTWSPYLSDVYRGLDEERANAGKLRRLAARRTQELMERNGIQQ